MAFKDVGALVAPRNIALVGASDRQGHWSKRVWDNLTRFGFEGSVFAVNPNYDTLWGSRCYGDISALPEPVDHLALFVPADVTLDVLAAAAPLGARSATLYAAGFGEGGDETGRARAERLKTLLNDTGIAAAGPNCMGIASGNGRFVTMADERLAVLRPGPVALLTQSGMLASTLTRSMTDRGLNVGYLISCGNQIGLTFADYIDFLADDGDVRVIACYIETVLDPARFLAAARKARANGKTVVAVKIGGSELSRSAALAHTGNLAGSLQVFDAYALEAGIVRVGTLEELIEAAEFLCHAPMPRGPNIAFMTNSGALKSLMTEAATECGLGLATLSETTTANIAAALGEEGGISNPLDTKKTIETEKYMRCISALAKAPEVDIVVAIEELPAEAGVERKVNNLQTLNQWCRGARETADHRTATVSLLTPVGLSDTTYMRGLRAELESLPLLYGLGTSIRALSALTRPAGVAIRDAGKPHTDTETPAIATELRQEACKLQAPAALNEVRSKQLVAAYGLALATERAVDTIDAAVAAACDIGYPVVVKGVTPVISHKSDAGLVALSLDNDDAVRHAVERIDGNARDHDVALDGYLVAEHVSDGLEVLVGMHRDPEMGAAIMVGVGGVLLELIDDVALVTPDVDAGGALSAIAATRLNTLLKGYRGGPAYDVEALADMVVGMGQLARDLGPAVLSVDINPVMVRPKGEGAVALDALVVLQPHFSGD